MTDPRMEAATVAGRLHKVMSSPKFHDGSMVGTLAGLLLYALSVARAMGLSTPQFHDLVDAIDHDFAIVTMRATKSREPNDIEAAVRKADQEADRIIAAIAKEVKDEEP